MKYLQTLLGSILLCSCSALGFGGGQTELQKLHTTLDTAEQLVKEMAVIVAPTDPDSAKVLGEFSVMVGELDAQVEATMASGGSQLDVVQSIDFFLNATSSFTGVVTDDPAKQLKIADTVAKVRAALLLYKLVKA